MIAKELILASVTKNDFEVPSLHCACNACTIWLLAHAASWDAPGGQCNPQNMKNDRHHYGHQRVDQRWSSRFVGSKRHASVPCQSVSMAGICLASIGPALIICGGVTLISGCAVILQEFSRQWLTSE